MARGRKRVTYRTRPCSLKVLAVNEPRDLRAS